MKTYCRIVGVLVLFGGLLVGPVMARDPGPSQDIDWQQVKATWNSLTPEEQEIYRQRMPAPARPLEAAGSHDRLRGILIPPTDTCEPPPSHFNLPVSDNGSTVGFANDYDIQGIGGACDTGFDSNGPDVAYSMFSDITCDVMASVTGDFDEVLYVTTNCTDLATGCVGSSDVGDPESVSFTATAGTEYYVIVDGWNSNSGNYTLDITETTSTGCNMWPVELQSFSVD